MDREARLQALLAEMELQRVLLRSGTEEIREGLLPTLISQIRPWQLAARLLHTRPVWLGAASILMTLWRRSRAHRRRAVKQKDTG